MIEYMKYQVKHKNMDKKCRNLYFAYNIKQIL